MNDPQSNHVTTSIYDASALDEPSPGDTTTYIYDSRGRPLDALRGAPREKQPLPDPQQPSTAPTGASRPGCPSLRLVTHTFEFRLQGAADEEQAIAVDQTDSAGFFVALKSVEVSLARGEPAGLTPGLVSGLSVNAGMCGGQLVCGVRLADFAADELVVIRVVASVYFLTGP